MLHIHTYIHIYATYTHAACTQVLVSSFLDADKLGGALTAPHYSGMVDCFKQTYRAEGIRGFYKGLSPTLLKSFVGTAVTFGAYEFMSEMLHEEKEKRRGRVESR